MGMLMHRHFIRKNDVQEEPKVAEQTAEQKPAEPVEEKPKARRTRKK